MERPGKHPLVDAYAALDDAVAAAYGISQGNDALSFLWLLNRRGADSESRDEKIIGPGLPSTISDPKTFVSAGCIAMP